MTKRMIFMLAGCIVVFGLVFGAKWFSNKMMNQFVDAMPVPAATVSAAAVQQMTWDNVLEAVGSFVPENGADVTTEVGGIVTSIAFESGARVQKGAQLITLDSTTERAEAARLKAQSELANLNRTRREKLWKLESLSKADYDSAVSESNVARAAAEGQAALIAKKDIRAPFAGLLGIRRVNVGQYLQPGTAIVTLQSLDPIYLDFSLPEQHTGVVQPGYEVSVKVDSYPEQPFKGKVLAVEPRIDAATRNFLLRAQLPNPDFKLRPGQFGRVVLTLPGQRNLLVVPRTAISYSSYGTAVFVVEKNTQAAAGKDAADAKPAGGPPAPPPSELKVVQRFVKLGEVRGDFVAVIDGLKPGEQVATSGLLKLRNDQPVNIDNSVQPEPKLDPKPSES